MKPYASSPLSIPGSVWAIVQGQISSTINTGGRRSSDPQLNPIAKTMKATPDFNLILQRAGEFASTCKGLNKALRENAYDVAARTEAVVRFNAFILNLDSNTQQGQTPQGQKLLHNLDLPGAYEFLAIGSSKRKMGLAFLFGAYGSSVPKQDVTKIVGLNWINKVNKRSTGSIIETKDLENATVRAMLKTLPPTVVAETKVNEEFAGAVADLCGQVNIDFNKVINSGVNTDDVNAALQMAASKATNALLNEGNNGTADNSGRPGSVTMDSGTPQLAGVGGVSGSN